jgi:hypothetical protein
MCDQPGSFRSGSFFDGQHVRSFAISCSDGRFGECYDDFLHEALGLPHYDRLAVPGGPAHLTQPASGIEDHARFLIEAHDIQHIVLIAHEDCGYYKHHFTGHPDEIRDRQIEDLKLAARRLREGNVGLHIEAYYAAIEEDRVRFDPVMLD